MSFIKLPFSPKIFKKTSTRRGVASLYVVIFATILFGVIVLSFIRIVLSESIQSSNDDLSQSAYDSALAGVEDAKIAVNRYYQCINDPAQANCGTLFGGNCDNFYLKHYLYPSSTDSSPVVIQSSGSSSDSFDQAYTCVIVNNVVSDYRSTLTSDNRTRVVPIGIGSNSLSGVKEIEFSWYSEINGTQFKSLNDSGKLADRDHASTPPVISLTLLRTGANINLDSFNNSTSGDYSTMILLPSESNAAINNINNATIMNAGNSAASAMSEGGALAPAANTPFLIKCEHAEFACTVRLTDLSFATGGNALLVISMPYGDIITDFAVALKDNNGHAINFENVQVSVDSTGRANQLVRRVETRLDPADIFFPYPQYEVELTGSDADSLWKYFWITYNCWTEEGTCNNNGSL